ncbi:hypothetical protein GYMLUDRAFT_247208 [Collybiopsis luxurians FD-317 M1]|uniref:Uncharacterized protein n=1 Tax=Collybiopsis luxurians FD-317 M1 TaxID=944289 RepID=A0A0D0B239_9AGAR|nr:hypothetical protein GYMLUDRAFT_247208 [Collybiopsis luxurians FD-317 M1]
MALKYDFVINPFIVIFISVLLYGVHLTLFINAIYLLTRKQRVQAHRYFHIVTLVALFLFATAAIIVDIIGSAGAIIVTFELFDGTITTVEQSNGSILLLNILEEVILLMYSLANIVADAILLFRLYAVWGRRRSVLVVPVIVVILNNILAIIDTAIRLRVNVMVDGPEKNQSMSDSDMFWAENATVMTFTFMIVNLVVNTLVTGLIGESPNILGSLHFIHILLAFLEAGRIWWISRNINALYGRKGSQRKYARVVAIILESGVLYPVSILVALVITQRIPTSPNLFAILAEVVAIAPTLIIVRVAMGVDINEEQGVVYNTGIARIDTERVEGRGKDAQGILSTLMFATGENDTQFTSVVNLSTAHGSCDTSTNEDNRAIKTYHTARSRMSSAPPVRVTSRFLTLPGQAPLPSS